MMKLEWDYNSGGSNGPNMLLRLDGNCIGHFYEDASGAIDADDVREDIAIRYNSHDALVAALEKSQAAWRDYGMETDPAIDVPLAHRNMLGSIDAALALARGEG